MWNAAKLLLSNSNLNEIHTLSNSMLILITPIVARVARNDISTYQPRDYAVKIITPSSHRL